MFRKSLMVVTLGVTLAGCAVGEALQRGTMPTSPPEAFAHRVATSEVLLFWNCLRPEPGLLRLEGVAKNPWQAQPIRYLEFELVGLDAQERTTALASGAARDLQIFTNQSAPFELHLKPAGTEVRFDLYYRYRFDSEFDMTGLLAGPPLRRPRLFVQTNTFLARDVCPEFRNRAR